MRTRSVSGDNMRAVIFDMDGVLFDTESLCSDCWMSFANEIGADREQMQKAILACVGRNANDCVRVAEEMLGKDFPYQEYRKKTELLMLETIEREGMPMKPGVREILEWLKSHGYRIAMASSSSRKSVCHHLERAGILDYFETLTTGDMVEHSKPQPDIYLKACEELGVAPGQALAVEDSFNGIRSAYAAGLYTVMVPDQLPPTEEILALVDKKCDSLTELQAQLPELLAVCGD